MRVAVLHLFALSLCAVSGGSGPEHHANSGNPGGSWPLGADLGDQWRTYDGLTQFPIFLQLRSTRHFSMPQRRQFPERLPQWAPDPPPLTAEDIKILAAF